MTLRQELELRLSDLKSKLAEEKACLNPVLLYIDDLNTSIRYCERRIKAAAS